MSIYLGPRGKEKTFKYTVEIPNPEREDYEYIVLQWFYDEESARKWARENLGADENGNINVITKIPL